MAVINLWWFCDPKREFAAVLLLQTALPGVTEFHGVKRSQPRGKMCFVALAEHVGLAQPGSEGISAPSWGWILIPGPNPSPFSAGSPILGPDPHPTVGSVSRG